MMVSVPEMSAITHLRVQNNSHQYSKNFKNYNIYENTITVCLTLFEAIIRVKA
jgi:hypothetical protein